MTLSLRAFVLLALALTLLGGCAALQPSHTGRFDFQGTVTDASAPEFWNQFKTDFAPGTHVRIHPLLDWTELHIWEYIKREKIPTVSLYYDQGKGTRYRSLGCGPCQAPIQSTAKNVDDIIVELKSGKLKNIAERSGRLQDGKHGLEELRREGYM